MKTMALSLSNITVRSHLLFSFIIRIALILYGIYQDKYSTVPYTDIDYKVFTDASRHILNEGSPYDRHTYRYSPLLAFLLTCNIVFHDIFGKVLFCIVDIGVGLLIRSIVMSNLNDFKTHCNKSSFKALFLQDSQTVEKSKVTNEIKTSNIRQRKRSKQNLNKRPKSNVDSTKSIVYNMADKSMLMWLYNPMTIAISTRGNCDSLSSFIVLYTLYYLEIVKRPFIAGLIHGLSVHFRLYPLVYSLTMFMYLSKYSYYAYKKNDSVPEQVSETNVIESKENLNTSLVPKKNERKTIFKRRYLLYLVPNQEQVYLVCGCLLSLSTLTAFFYYVFGYQFLYETYIYHLTRVDFRHNFSLYFYLQYLTAWVRNIGLWQKALMMLPQLVLLLVFAIRYGLNKFSFNFAILLQTIVLVIYNRVLTSQYFIWIMALLPLCIWQIQMTKKRAMVIFSIWFVAQAAWLLPAYLLEFQGENTFFFIWIQSVSFFCANIAILGRLIIHFMHENNK